MYIKNLNEGNYLNVNKYAVHRIKAKTNIMLYEVSTPHLADVIRISDDTKRDHGRINSEHKNYQS